MRFLTSLVNRVRRIDVLERRAQRIQETLGRIEMRQLVNARSIREAEFRVFSQWGEDGIIQYLIRRVPIERPLFVEFGVEDYTECNTRFLLVNDNWAGLAIDGDAGNVASIRGDNICWRHDFRVTQAFVTRENIDDLLRANGIAGDIGLLSIDIDGNDYWVWEAISAISPRIVVVEYNARFGAEKAVTIPYDPMFDRRRAHSSTLYYGASLHALELLGRRKGYRLIGGNSAGNNAFFVREDCCPTDLPAVTVTQAFAEPRFREARDEQGRLLYLSHDEERTLIAALPLVDVSR